MTWWWRSHKGSWVIAVAFASALTSFVLNTLVISFPAFSGTSPFASVPIYVIAPVVPLLALSLAQTFAAPPIYRAAARSMRWREWLLSIGVLAASMAAAILTETMGWSHWQEYMRSLTGLLGLQLLLSPLLTYRYQAIAPVLYLFVAALGGRAADGSVNDWAWLIAPQISSWQFAQSIALLVIGSVIAVRYSGRTMVMAER